MTKCANYEFCTGEKMKGSEYCTTCCSKFKCGFGWDKLTIVDAIDECAICMNDCGRKLMFPTNCGHSFCLDCSRNILFWDESRYYLSPVPYGCAPCPNGCANPQKGKQCTCVQYESVKDAWSLSNPASFDKWISDETRSVDIGSNENTYGTASCPFCRKQYVT